jgi:cytochrome o ubiquinol oxidase subunit 3
MLTKTISHDTPESHDDHSSNTVLGFWVYLMTDCIIFASLFAVFAVMGNQFAAGPSGKEVFELPGVMLETAILLFSSITFGFGMLAAYKGKKAALLAWLGVTFLLGAAFIALEIHEFQLLIQQGYGPGTSAFLSAFFTLVGTHGLHVTAGLIWMVVLAVQVIGSKKITQRDLTRLACLSLFWHFLDIVWICVFTFVYLTSVV